MNQLITHAEYFARLPIRGPVPCPEFTPDPPQNLASRTMSLHSAISVHGYTFIDGRKVWYESVLERCCALLGRLRPDVVEVAEQPPAVTFIGDAGRELSHTFDFKFTTTTPLGRVLTAVKPSALVAESGVDRIVELVAEQLSPSIADAVTLFTEHMLSEVDLFNAEAVNLATRDPCPEDDAALARIIAKLKGETSIGDLADGSGLGAYGYDAVLRAMDVRKLRLVEYCKLDFDAVIARPAKRKD